MKKRIITAIVALALFVPVLLLHETVYFTAVMALLSAVAVFEFSSCIGAPVWLRGVGAAIGATLPLAADFDISGEYTAELFRHFALPAAIFSAAMFIFAYRFKPKRQFLPVFIAAVLYPSTAFGLIVYFKTFQAYPLIFLMFFINSWVTDSFAMIVGGSFGKNKLCPFLSPKKTVEGSAGGTIAAVIAFLIYGLITKTPLLESAFLGLLLSVAAQCGDLLASALKRAYDAKDFGKVFPGHGGVVDRFDSVFLTAHMFNALTIIWILLV